MHTLAPHDRKKLRQQTFPNCLLNENSHRESNYMGYLFPVLSPPADLIVSSRMAFRAWQITEKWNSVISFTHFKLQLFLGQNCFHRVESFLLDSVGNY